ncbi:hypothetical protein K466DRAFT_464262, partial [Polyporus arcularius HHB13444]
ITAAYAFTDYRSQGQTIPSVIVDLHTPPGGRLTLFNIYVALSRSNLLQEDERLERLNEYTRRWWQRMGRDR